MNNNLPARNASTPNHRSADRFDPADNLNPRSPQSPNAKEPGIIEISPSLRGWHTALGRAVATRNFARVTAMVVLGVVLTALGVRPVKAANYQTEVLADSPLVYYRLDETNDTTALNLGSLLSAADGIYSDITTDVLLGQSSASAGLGTAVKLDFGSVRVPDLAQGPLTQFTIELWINRQADPGPGAIFAMYAGDGFSGNTLHFNLQNVPTAAGPYIEFAIPGSGAHPHLFPMWPSNEWHHLVVTRDTNSAVRAYLDGRFLAQGTKTAGPEFTGGNIGAWGSTRNLPALIDEFAIYNTVLSEARIAAHFNAAGLTLNPPEIILQPVGATVFPGDVFAFTAAARGQALAFQWFKTNAIPGATSYGYTIDPIAASDGGSYTLQVSNQVSSVVSSNAVLTVSTSPKPITLLWHWTFDTASVVNTTELLNAVAGRANGISRDAALAGFAPGAPIISTTDKKVGDGALECNGNTFVQTFDDAALNNLPAYTFAAWVKVNTLSANGAIFSHDGGTPAQSLQVMALANGNVSVTYDAGKVLTATPPSGWFHLAFTHDANVTNAMLYIDGVAVTDDIATLRGNLTAGGTSLGSVGWANNRFNGLLDDVRVYDGALSAAAIAALPAVVLPPPVAPTVVSAQRDFLQATKVTVQYSVAVTAASATNVNNYALNNGGTISGASLSANGKTVVLTTSPLSNGVTNILTINNVQETRGALVIAPNTPVTISVPGDTIRAQYSLGGTNLLVLEAEHFNLNTSAAGISWIFTNAPPLLLPTDANTNYSGEGSMLAEPNGGLNLGSPALGSVPGGSPRLDFKVQFTTTGTFYVWVRGVGDSAPGASANDSVFIGLDGALTTGVTGFAEGAGYAWANAAAGNSGPIVISTPGLHVLNVWMREDGFAVDKFLLASDSAFAPTNLGPAESPVVVLGPTITVTRSGADLILTWPGGGTLQSSTNAAGTYVDLPAASSPFSVSPTGTQKYFRVRK